MEMSTQQASGGLLQKAEERVLNEELSSKLHVTSAADSPVASIAQAGDKQQCTGSAQSINTSEVTGNSVTPQTVQGTRVTPDSDLAPPVDVSSHAHASLTSGMTRPEIGGVLDMSAKPNISMMPDGHKALESSEDTNQSRTEQPSSGDEVYITWVDDPMNIWVSLCDVCAILSVL